MKLTIKEALKSESDLKTGALVVKDGKIISRGFRTVAGDVGIHAEEMAIKNCDNLNGCTLYLTLEPCFYRNNELVPCCDLIIESGIKKVVIGLKDTNSKIFGRSIEKLKWHGIDVTICNEGLEKELLELLGYDYIRMHG